MKKAQCKEAIEIYRKFLTRQETVQNFLKLAEVSALPLSPFPPSLSLPSLPPSLPLPLSLPPFPSSPTLFSFFLYY